MPESLILVVIYLTYFALSLPLARRLSSRFDLPLAPVLLAPVFCCYVLSWASMLIPSWARRFDGSGFILGNQILGISVAIGFVVALVVAVAGSIVNWMT